VALLAIGDGNEETAKLFSINHQGQASLLDTLVSGSEITRAQCTGARFLAVVAKQNNRDRIFAGPAPLTSLREYDDEIIGLDLIANAQGGALMAVTRSDGVIELEALNALGASDTRQVAVGAPKVAGAGRLIAAPSGAVLAYPVLQPAFERGVWATPVAMNGDANGAQQRLTSEEVPQTTTASLQSTTAGMGHFLYVGTDGLRMIFLGCAPP
jgi:hypothetical protein